MPGLTIATDVHPAPATAQDRSATSRRASSASQTSSPPRPPVSPITPTLEPAVLPSTGVADAAMTTTQNAIPDFALGRPVFTHTTQTDQVANAPPPAQPIDFDSNPDVLALKSAISILQLQRARATADIQSLSRARDAALADPQAFAADLQAGKVRVEGDPLFSGTRAAGDEASDDSDSDSSDTDSNDDEPDKQEETPDSETKTEDSSSSSSTTDGTERTKPNRKGKQKPSTTQSKPQQPPPWQNLPKPQTIVRCPPINWAQYGVVGESLDKLHAEQLAAPTPGAPMVLGRDGTYEFKAGGAGADQNAPAAASGSGAGTGEQPRRLVGVAAPYNPLRDKVEKKGKGGKR